MAIGHHINDRSHVIEKEVGADGNLEERQEFVNLDEGLRYVFFFCDVLQL